MINTLSVMKNAHGKRPRCEFKVWLPPLNAHHYCYYHYVNNMLGFSHAVIG